MSCPLLQDRELLRAFRAGERAALTRVYLLFAKEVAQMLASGFRFQAGGQVCRFHGYRSRFEMEDALHDVFARAFDERARHGYDGLRPYRAYLFGICRTVVVDDHRSAQRDLRQFTVSAEPDSAATDASDAGVEPLEGIAESTGDPERDVENAELTGLVRNFRSGLDPIEAEVFRLRFSEGKSLSEVEAATGRSPSRVKTLELRLRRRLLELIWVSGYLQNWRPAEKEGAWFARLIRSFERLDGRPSN